MRSEEIALAAADLATVETLRARVLEWEDAYDRLEGAFDLHMDILECKQALSSYAGIVYDVIIGDLAEQRDQCRAALDVAHQENEQHREVERKLQAALDATEIENAVLRDNERSVEVYAARMRRLEADAGWLRGLVQRAIKHLDGYGEIGTPIAAMAEDLEVMLGRTGDAGAALLAELEAARAVVKAATLLGTGPDSETWTAMYAAIEAYDAVVKASKP